MKNAFSFDKNIVAKFPLFINIWNKVKQLLKKESNHGIDKQLDDVFLCHLKENWQNKQKKKIHLQKCQMEKCLFLSVFIVAKIVLFVLSGSFGISFYNITVTSCV